ncbi:MAG TPA: NUDIX hydrolase [Candidatus Limnocylindria bacterium]|nr:NUDIX hydrolase [Candidatus Limnocylindria bacterium]
MERWRVLERRTLLDRRPWYTIEEQRIQLPDGRVVEGFPRIALRDYAIVVALTPAAEVLTHRMYKHGTGRVTLDLVAGLIEDGETPLAAAQRELREETGYQSDRWAALGSYIVNSNYGCGRMHAFVAQDARQTTEPDSGDLEQMELILRPLHLAIDDVRAGHFELLSAVAALGLAHIHLRQDRP